MSEPGRGAQRIREALGGDFEVVEFPETTRTAADAAKAIGCSVAQIAKSIVFRMTGSRQPLVVIASGANRVNEARVAALVGEPIEKADAGFVREATGFAIGGVPPIAHAQPIRTIIDEDLMKLGEIWAAAGTPNSVFRLEPQKLVAMTSGAVEAIK
jgi:prolyl-tRNA editing enzyme YbaK/EbsC (Cys-tRNA(Pro) deacylase)